MNKILSPETDANLFKAYNKKTLRDREINKKELQKELGLRETPETFLLSITTELSDGLKGEELFMALEGALEIGVQVVLRGRGTQKYREYAEKLAKKHPENMRIMEDSDKSLSKMYAGADASLFLHINEATIEDLANCLAYGNVPIVMQYRKLEDFNPIEERGNCILIQKTSPWHIFESIIRAKETHRFPYDWANLQKAGMSAKLD